MGFSFLALSLLRAGLPDTPWRPLVDGFGYSLGFVIVILGRQQLFTESTLTAVLPVLTSRTIRALLSALRLWGIVLAFNLIGTFVFAALITPEGAFPSEIRASLLEVGRESVSGGFGPTLLKAIFAGWLIALMVWLLPNAGPSRLWVIILLTYVVSIGRFSHIIAGSAEAIFAVFTGKASSTTTSWGSWPRPWSATPWAGCRWSRCSITHRSLRNCGTWERLVADQRKLASCCRGCVNSAGRAGTALGC
jgi:formate-nitrite transporter family protein